MQKVFTADNLTTTKPQSLMNKHVPSARMPKICIQNIKNNVSFFQHNCLLKSMCTEVMIRGTQQMFPKDIFQNYHQKTSLEEKKQQPINPSKIKH